MNDMQNTDINTMTPDELRTNLIDVCRVRDTLYAALDGKAHELAQRDARIAELEAESYRNREWARTWKAAAKSNRKDYQLFLAGYGTQMAQIKSLDTEREYWRKMYQLECSRVPFEQVPAPVNPDAPAELSMRGGIEAFTEECAHHALTGE